MRARSSDGKWARQHLKQLCVALYPETMAEVDRLAQRKKVSRSELIRDFIEWGLENGNDNAHA